MSFNVVVAVNAWATCMAALDVLLTCICVICFSFHQLHVTSGLAGSMLLLACRRHPAVVGCSTYMQLTAFLCISHSSQPADSLRPAHPCNSLRAISYRTQKDKRPKKL